MLLLFLLPPSGHVGNRGVAHLGSHLSHCLPEQVHHLGVHAPVLALCQRPQCVPQVGGESHAHAHFFSLHNGIKATVFCIHCTRLKMVVKCIHKLWNPSRGKGCRYA